MQNEKKSRDIAFATLLDSINVTNENDILIGEYQRKIAEIENKKQQDLRNTSIMAAKYFTKDRIVELHQKSIELLSCNDFSEEEYIRVFSDISTIDLGHIMFLVDRQKEIDSFEAKLNDKNQQFEDNGPHSIMSRIEDILMRGGAKDD